MIKVFIPTDKEFNYKECKKLYKKYQKKINDNQPFREIVSNTFYYSFFNENGFIGCLYFYNKNNRLYVNGFANRHKPTSDCLKMSLDWFNCDIYAQTQHKTAIFCLLRSGFKKIENNLYKYERR